MQPSEEELWSRYALAAIAAGHHTPDRIDQIARDAVDLHRRRFPLPAITENETPAQPEKPAKGKDSAR